MRTIFKVLEKLGFVVSVREIPKLEIHFGGINVPALGDGIDTEVAADHVTSGIRAAVSDIIMNRRFFIGDTIELRFFLTVVATDGGKNK